MIVTDTGRFYGADAFLWGSIERLEVVGGDWLYRALGTGSAASREGRVLRKEAGEGTSGWRCSCGK